MSTLATDFVDDLHRTKQLAQLLKLIDSCRGVAIPTPLPTDALSAKFSELKNWSDAHHQALSILAGTLVLYLSGRFEEFARDTFEELCERLRTKCGSYDNLPKSMRENLIRWTAEVMTNPRRYGHAERGVEAFVQCLAAGFADRTKLVDVNATCLSITHENMRPEVLGDLFSRVGVKDLWLKLCSQAAMQKITQQSDANAATSAAKTKLTNIMILRNKIAHPADMVEWPTPDGVIEMCEFFEALGSTLFLVIDVYEIELGMSTRPPIAPPVAPGSPTSPPIPASAPTTGGTAAAASC